MRGFRKEFHQALDALIDFGIVRASRLSERMKNVLVTVTGAETNEGFEQADDQPFYGNAAVLVRPAAPTDAGHVEVVYARVGDEMVVLAHRDVRWQVDLEEGEVVLRNMSDTAARIWLKADGSVIVEAQSIKLGSKDASESAVKGDANKSAFDDFRSGLITWIEQVRLGIVAGGGALDNTDFTVVINALGTSMSNALSSKTKLE